MSKIALTGNASGTGVFTVASPNSNTDRTLTLPDAAGTMMLTDTGVTTAQMPAGSVIQVVSATSSTNISATTTTTILSASITPSSTANKVFIIANCMLSITPSSNMYGYASIEKGAAVIYQVYSGISSAVAGSVSFCLQGMDSPASTSSQTYDLKINKASGGTTSVQTDSYPYAITLMEIAA